MTVKGIAVMVGSGESTVKRRLRRLRAALSNALGLTQYGELVGSALIEQTLDAYPGNLGTTERVVMVYC